MKTLTKEELKIFEQLQEKAQGSCPNSILMSVGDFKSLLIKELEKDADMRDTLQNLEYFLDCYNGKEVLYYGGYLTIEMDENILDEVIYVWVYYSAKVERKDVRKKIFRIGMKAKENRLQLYQRMGALAGAIMLFGNKLLEEHFWKTVCFEEIKLIERLRVIGVTYEDLVAEIQYRKEANFEKMHGRVVKLIDISSVRLLHCLNLWHAFPVIKRMLEIVKERIAEGESVDVWMDKEVYECRGQEVYERWSKLLCEDVPVNHEE